MEQDILKIIAANPASTMAEMAAKLNVTKRTIELTISYSTNPPSQNSSNYFPDQHNYQDLSKTVHDE
ncbi:MAG: hypothetical protein LUF78_04295 [Clostridiales bacterium]|nr:hypothetical protein [Clostridiales bacterium]